MRNHILILLLLCAACGPAAPAGTNATDTDRMQKAEQLQSQPFRDAETVAMLAAGDRVQILERQGGWYRVRSAKGSGWVRMLGVRRGEASATSAATEVSGLLNLASGRAGTGNVVASTGIRGLTEEQLKTARYSKAELERSDTFVQSATAARRFALQGKLAARKLDYLPAPSQ